MSRHRKNIMAQPSWNKTLAEVLQQETVTKTFISKSTGKEYESETVEELEVVSTGSVEESKGQYNYSVVDTEHQLEYTIKAPNFVEVAFGDILVFRDVVGGALNNGRGWYKAEKVVDAK